MLSGNHFQRRDSKPKTPNSKNLYLHPLISIPTCRDHTSKLSHRMSYFNKRLRSFGYAFKGIAYLFRTQANAQIHLLAVLVICGWGAWLGLAPWEWCAILICMALVITAEAINTAIEATIDRISTEKHPLAGRAKDVAAGAVLLSVIFCGIVWGIIFLPKLGEAMGG
jgi:diacylglycerol kinase (ATP)